MNSRNTKHGTSPDPELVSQEKSGPLAWFIFHAIALWSTASHWLKFKRICAWHRPRPRRIGGNPFSSRISHGICPECFARISGEIISHGETGLRVSVTKDTDPNEPSLPAPPARNGAAPAWLQRPAPATQTRPGGQFSVGKILATNRHE